MFFSIQSADHPSLARPHWFNALGGAVNRFAGGSTELAGSPEFPPHLDARLALIVFTGLSESPRYAR